MLLQSAAESCMGHVVVFTFDFEVVSSKTVGLEVEGQWRVGLIQEQVDPGQLNAVPLKHWSKNFSGSKQTKRPSIMIQTATCFLFFSSPVAPPPPLLPQCFLFHCRYNFCVYVHVEIKLEAEALLTGVLQGERTHC